MCLMPDETAHFGDIPIIILEIREFYSEIAALREQSGQNKLAKPNRMRYNADKQDVVRSKCRLPL